MTATIEFARKPTYINTITAQGTVVTKTRERKKVVDLDKIPLATSKAYRGSVF